MFQGKVWPCRHILGIIKDGIFIYSENRYGNSAAGKGSGQDYWNLQAKAAIEVVNEIMDSISCLDEDFSHKLSKDYKSELKIKLNELIN